MERIFANVANEMPPWLASPWPAFSDIIDQHADVISLDEIRIGRLGKFGGVQPGMVTKVEAQYGPEVMTNLQSDLVSREFLAETARIAAAGRAIQPQPNV